MGTRSTDDAMIPGVDYNLRAWVRPSPDDAENPVALDIEWVGGDEDGHGLHDVTLTSEVTVGLAVSMLDVAPISRLQRLKVAWHIARKRPPSSLPTIEDA